jgi:hypothetical protein
VRPRDETFSTSIHLEGGRSDGLKAEELKTELFESKPALRLQLSLAFRLQPFSPSAFSVPVSVLLHSSFFLLP